MLQQAVTTLDNGLSPEVMGELAKAVREGRLSIEDYETVLQNPEIVDAFLQGLFSDDTLGV